MGPASRWWVHSRGIEILGNLSLYKRHWVYHLLPPEGEEVLGNIALPQRTWVQRRAGGREEKHTLPTVGSTLEVSTYPIRVRGSSIMLAPKDDKTKGSRK